MRKTLKYPTVLALVVLAIPLTSNGQWGWGTPLVIVALLLAKFWRL